MDGSLPNRFKWAWGPDLGLPLPGSPFACDGGGGGRLPVEWRLPVSMNHQISVTVDRIEEDVGIDQFQDPISRRRIISRSSSSAAIRIARSRLTLGIPIGLTVVSNHSDSVTRP